MSDDALTHMQNKYGQYMELVHALAAVGQKLEMVLSDPELVEIAAPRLGKENLDALGDVIFAICAQGIGRANGGKGL